MENKYKEGQVVYAKVDPGLKLVIRRYVDTIHKTLCLTGRKKIKREYSFILVRRTINNMIGKKKDQLKYK
jgi:hypothetical protein